MNNDEHIAYIIGNGPSRKKHSLGELGRNEYITTYGCNVLYRHFPSNYLIANDALVIHEIVRNDYNESKCLFTDWNPISREHENVMMEQFQMEHKIIRSGSGDMFTIYGW